MSIFKWLSKFRLIKNKRKEKYLRSIFYEIIRRNVGKITVMEYAMKANITGIEAKKYLEKYAVEFTANFEATKEGYVVYLFPMANKDQDKYKNNYKENGKQSNLTQEHEIKNDSKKDYNRRKKSARYNKQNLNNIPPKDKNDYTENIKEPVKYDLKPNKLDVNNIEKGIRDLTNDIPDIGNLFDF